jgi:hypothetical protein
VIALFLATALGASPGGVRLGPGIPTTAVSLRHILVDDRANDLHIHQSTLRLVTGPYPWGLDLSLPVVVGWGGGWREFGLGQIRLGARRWMGARHAPVSLGVEWGLPMPDPLSVQVWSSIASETLPGVEMMVVAEGALWPSAPLSWRVGAGFRQGPHFGALFAPLPLLDASAAFVQPVMEPLSLGLEAELVLGDFTPGTLRPFLRLDVGGWSFDAILQVPVHLVAERRLTPQGGLQVRYFPPLPTTTK